MAETIVSKSYKIATDSSGNNWDKVSMWKVADDVDVNYVDLTDINMNFPTVVGGITINKINNNTISLVGIKTNDAGIPISNIDNLKSNTQYKISVSDNIIQYNGNIYVNAFKNNTYIKTLITTNTNGIFTYDNSLYDYVRVGINIPKDSSINANISYSLSEGTSLQSTVGNIKGIANNLTTTEEGYALDARQGAALAAMFGGLTFGLGIPEGGEEAVWGYTTPDGTFVSFGGEVMTVKQFTQLLMDLGMFYYSTTSGDRIAFMNKGRWSQRTSSTPALIGIGGLEGNNAIITTSEEGLNNTNSGAYGNWLTYKGTAVTPNGHTVYWGCGGGDSGEKVPWVLTHNGVESSIYRGIYLVTILNGNDNHTPTQVALALADILLFDD